MNMKKNNRVWNIISWAVLALLIVAEGVAVYQIWKLKMLPGKYFSVLLAVIAVITLLLVTLLFQKRGRYQKKARHGKQIVGWILSLVIICGCFFGGGAVARLNETMSAITSVSTVNVLLDVYVRSDDPAQYINDCGDYVFGVVESEDTEQVRSAVEDIESVLGSGIETKNYDNVFSMVDGLYADEVDVIIMNSSYVDILGELDEYSDFSEKVRLIHEHVAQKVVIQLPTQEQEEKKGDITEEPFLLYISGNDARKTLLANGGSDVNILLAVNPVEKQILMVSTPRDYFVANPAGDNALDKLSHCGLAGIENSVQAINQLYGQSIDYYAKINFSGFKTLVDAVGGVTIYSDVAFSSAHGVTIQKGENHLNGTQALAFVRERKALAGGDNDRGKNQMKVITAMINQLSAGTLIANYTDILNSLDGMFATSIPAEDIAKLVSMQLSDMASWDVLSYAVTGDNGHDQPWALNGLFAYVMYPHEEKVEFASGLIDRVLSGEVLTEEDLIMSE